MNYEKLPKTISAEELLSTPLPPVKWIIPDLLPAGLALFAGPSKAGKSWLTLWLCLQVAQGKPMWGREIEPHTVLYLSLEDTFNRLQKRLLQLVGSEEAPERLVMQTECGSIGQGLEEQLTSFLYQHPDTGLIVIDTLQKVRSSDQNNSMYASDYKEISALKALADKYNICILLILYESPLYERNLNTMMDMILECKVSEDGYDENRMDILFGELEQRDPHHPAVLQYRSFKLGSAKTLSSIMVTAVSNLHMLQSAAFAEMIATDEMFLPKLGVEKRAIFCVIPDNDDTFNFMVSILYTQLFDQLFRLADSTPEFHGTLPVHVRLMMDEFANVATPENFVKILAVARSRNISCDIILQNISQIKSKYKDDWETIIGNCDSLVYLGGNDYSTFEYISKLLGKQTIRTKGQSIGKGSHGSSSDSYQVTGRELMTPDEVRRMKRSDCLVMISGEAPVRDKKYNLFDHPNLKYTPDYRSPRGLLHRFATPIPAPEGYTMPPDYMAQAGTVSLAYVAELTCPDITEDLYDELQEWEESLL